MWPPKSSMQSMRAAILCRFPTLDLDERKLLFSPFFIITHGNGVSSGVKSILKLYLSKSIVTDGKTTPSKVESIV